MWKLLPNLLMMEVVLLTLYFLDIFITIKNLIQR